MRWNSKKQHFKDPYVSARFCAHYYGMCGSEFISKIHARTLSVLCVCACVHGQWIYRRINLEGSSITSFDTVCFCYSFFFSLHLFRISFTRHVYVYSESHMKTQQAKHIASNRLPHDTSKQRQQQQQQCPALNYYEYENSSQKAKKNAADKVFFLLLFSSEIRNTRI